MSVDDEHEDTYDHKSGVDPTALELTVGKVRHFQIIYYARTKLIKSHSWINHKMAQSLSTLDVGNRDSRRQVALPHDELMDNHNDPDDDEGHRIPWEAKGKGKSTQKEPGDTTSQSGQSQIFVLVVRCCPMTPAHPFMIYLFIVFQEFLKVRLKG